MAPPPRPAPPATPGRYGPEPAAEPTALEVQVMERAALRLAGGGERPVPSASLVLAARELAGAAAAGDPAPIGPARLRGALARALSYDAAPSAYLVSAAPHAVEQALEPILTPGGATHLGAGAIERDGKAIVVLLAADRRTRLDPFPREVDPGARAVLSGQLGPGLQHPRVYAMAPGGEVREADVSGARGFRAPIDFPRAGRYTLEVVASGPNGPEIAALLAVSAGGAPLDPPEPPAATDPEAPGAAEARILEEVNALRVASGRAPLESSPKLSEVARRHSADMLARGLVAHVLPGTGDLPERLRRARVPFRAALENVAKGRSALAAHAAVEESPAHRANLLSPLVRRAGIGIARGRLASGAPVVYLTEILVQPVDDGSASPLTPETRVRETLWRERARSGRTPLVADPRLDDLAREAAAEMRRRDRPDTEDLAARALDLGRGLSAVDAFVATDPSDVARSANVGDPRFRRVGVGVSVGDSDRFGAGRLWIAVLYTD